MRSEGRGEWEGKKGGEVLKEENNLWVSLAVVVGGCWFSRRCCVVVVVFRRNVFGVEVSGLLYQRFFD